MCYTVHSFIFCLILRLGAVLEVPVNTYKLVCPCLLGVEGLVADELREMGAENVQPENGRVVFDGSAEMIARANIRSRFSERVLVLLDTFEANTFDALCRGRIGSVGRTPSQ